MALALSVAWSDDAFAVAPDRAHDGRIADDAHTYEIGACLMGLPLERIEVRVTAENNDARFGGLETKDPATPFNLQAVVKLDAPGVARDKLDELHAYASRNCPLTNLIRGGAPVSVTVAT